jgi:hypothetical protein
MILTLRLCVLYGFHKRQRLFPYTTLANWFCIITEVESVYCAVRTESLYNTDTVKGLKTAKEVRTITELPSFICLSRLTWWYPTFRV